MPGRRGWGGSSWTGIRCEDATRRCGLYKEEDTSAVRIEYFVENHCTLRVMLRSRVLRGACLHDIGRWLLALWCLGRTGGAGTVVPCVGIDTFSYCS